MYWFENGGMEGETRPIRTAGEEQWIPLVRQLLRGVRYGVVQIVIQDSKVIQVEKTEKVRLPAEH